MKKFLYIICLYAVTFVAYADCQLGERCDYFNNDIIIAPPYIGTYQCTLDPAYQENVQLEVRLLTQNTLAEPAPLVLDNNNKVGIIKVTPHDGQKDYLENDFLAMQTSVSFCDGRNRDNDCDIQPTIMCERLGD